ncbi:unknown [Crocosphaera subtropica ATCC 51142]|uniref:Uncharacterized protein n=2 Tax=Crocosphaera TaxID=263510 RepID=B1WQ50_CROS5|nr:unknown [Crocosphaera subtropica ATCC 51142]
MYIMNEPSRVTYSLEEMFSRLEQKIDKLENKLDTKIDTLENKLDTKIDTLENKLENNQKEVNQKLDKQSEEIATIKATLQAQQQLIQKIPDLAEKVGELKNWRQIVIIALTATISASITWLIRGGNLKP